MSLKGLEPELLPWHRCVGSLSSLSLRSRREALTFWVASSLFSRCTLLARFQAAVKRSGLLREARPHEVYDSPIVKRTKKAESARRRKQRAEGSTGAPR